MTNSSPKLIILFFTTITIIFSISPISNALSNCLLTPDLDLRTDPDAITTASTDYGNLVRRSPRAVLYPSSENDVVELVRLSNGCPTPFGIAARGHGHSVRGQAAAHGGVVVDMASLGRNGSRIRVSWEELRRRGRRAAVGTLSNAGISGQSSFFGPQISNVLQLDVITGKGDLVSCSEEMNSELFFAVLGGLGQFGIITRARIVLHKAPTTAKWVRLIYDEFSKFTSDQEHLIMKGYGNGPNYLEGSIITDKSPPNNWRSTSFYSPSHQTKIQSLLKANGGILYSLEFVKYYTNIHEELELMMVKDLRFVPGFSFKKDVPLFDFLNRVGSLELEEDNDEEEAHPWLNLFLPKSQIMDFHAAVILNLIHTQNQTSGPILFYPLNRQKWDDRTSAVVPEEDIFYTLGLLHSTKRSESHVFENLNKQILEVCQREGIRIKQYLPHYESKEDWVQHYGSKWATFQERKQKYDPRMLLSPGQRIFTPVMESDF
ncbi:hypothetical protein SASPL_117622 [Salvia splendens]|uniref:Cytokinin dehydrogenase 1 FAD/cytokinin binding domain-containing protein n=1 Tax=Salvia splendens TaxID=180675 RepID=A0A8X8XVU2_SALSN|nr:hypothetical protein SASPL_117622 [Salvia splendens]